MVIDRFGGGLCAFTCPDAEVDRSMKCFLFDVVVHSFRYNIRFGRPSATDEEVRVWDHFDKKVRVWDGRTAEPAQVVDLGGKVSEWILVGAH